MSTLHENSGSLFGLLSGEKKMTKTET